MNVKRVEEDPTIGWLANLQRSIDLMDGKPCTLCKGEFHAVVMLTSQDCSEEFKKLLQVPTNGKTRVLLTSICKACSEKPNRDSEIRKKLLDGVSPNRN